METLGIRLKKLREDHNLTLQQVGKIAGSNRVSAHHWENDNAEPKAKALSLLARYFNVSADYLLFGDNDPQLEKMKKTQDVLKKVDNLLKDGKLNQNDIETIDSEASTIIDYAIGKIVLAKSQSEITAQKTG